VPESAEAEALSAATRNVLETMFFTEVYGERGEFGPALAEGLQARLHFTGQRAGEFRIAIAPGSARRIAANFLGSEDEAGMPECQVRDVTCELANMICGSVLSRLAADVAFELSHPELSAASDGDFAWVGCAAGTFDFEKGSLSAAIRFE
jgi:CheY-specific phosphatase CheX